MATFEYKTKTTARELMKYRYVYFVIFFLTSVAVDGRTVELTLYPAKIAEPPQKYQLLPETDKQIDADAVPLYEKAIQSIPKDVKIKQIQEWLRLPAEQLPQQQAEATVQKCMESLRLIARAARCKDSPNLYRALANLPKPLVNIEKAIEKDLENLKDYNFLVRMQLEKTLKPAHDRMRMIGRRANTRLNALQCLEAIRHYAATHNGQLPEKLSDIIQMEVPKDVMSGKVFEYRRTSAGAVLKSVIPEGGRPKDMVNYVIVLKK